MMAFRLPNVLPILLRSMDLLGDFFRWWRAELIGMVPVSWQARLALIKPVLAASLIDRTLSLVLWTPAGERLLYAGAIDVQAVEKALAPLRRELSTGDIEPILLLQRHDVLMRQLSLPISARRRLNQVLAFELARQTPLTVEEACFGYRILNTSSSHFDVEFAVTDRTMVDEALVVLKSIRLFPKAIDVSTVDSGRAGFNLARQVTSHAPRNWGALCTTGLAMLIAALVVLLVEIEIDRQETLLEGLTADLAMERKQAMEVENLRREVNEADKRAAFLSERFEEKRITAAFHRLSRDLPDDIWLTQLQLQNGEFRLFGYAPEPTMVVNILEKSGFFSNAQFRSPSTRRGSGDVDRFDISTGLVQGGKS